MTCEKNGSQLINQEKSVYVSDVFYALTSVRSGRSDHESSEESKAHVLLQPLPELSGPEDVFL